MISEEVVEVTPGRDAAELARQLLVVAESTDNAYRVDDVKTTTSGPMGLAFMVPLGLYDAWQASMGVATEENVPPKAPKKATRKAMNGGED